MISTDSLARIALDLQLGISHQDRFHRLIQSVRSLLNSDASALLRYESGLIASLHCGFNAHGRMHSDIVGSEGSLLVPDTFLDDAGEILLNTRNGSERIAVPTSDRYAAEVQDFSAAILAGRAPRLALDESLRNLRVLDRIRAALDA